MSNVIEAALNVYQSLGVPLWNYNIISRKSHWNVSGEKGVLEISSNILQKYLWLSIRTSFFQNSPLWVIVGWGFLTPSILWRVPNVLYPTFLKFCPTLLPHCLQRSPQLTLFCFFDWIGDRATFDMLFH